MPGLARSAALLFALSACFDDPKPKGAPPPPGPGYGDGGVAEDERILSRDDCLDLRDQQLTLAAKEESADPKKQEQIVAELRVRRKEELAEWVKKCTGRAVHIKDLRCMKESITLSGFLACGTQPDAGPPG